MDRQHRRLAEECEEIRARLAETQQHVEQLQNALCAVAREAGNVSVEHACSRCEKSLMLVRDGRMCCPRCQYGRPL